MTTMVVISDPHCGSVYGITPPQHFLPHYQRIMREGWNEYCELARGWLEPDILVVNGDCIEGRQDRQGGAELITPDRQVQAEMAIAAIRVWKAKKIFMTYGTAYHTGQQAEDFEYGIADALQATIEGRLFLDVEGVMFDIRHKVGSSSVFHGRATALLREVMWGLIEEANKTGPSVDVVIRSHVRYHVWVETPDRIAFTTPGLQFRRGRFGSRECSGETHWGAIRLTIDKGKIVCKEKTILKLNANKPKIFKIGL